jgi:hypothetical protein
MHAGSLKALRVLRPEAVDLERINLASPLGDRRPPTPGIVILASIASQRGRDDKPTTFYAVSQLGDCLARLGRAREAEPLLLRSYQRARGTPSAVVSPDLFTDFRRRMIAYYDTTCQQEQAAFWRAAELDAAFPADPFAH